MRKIKSFKLFEYNELDVVNIQQEAKDNLAYLLDEDQFKISYYFGNISGLPTIDILYSDYIVVNIEIINKTQLNKIFWESIKDDVMPYLELVSDKYTLWSLSTEEGKSFWFDKDMSERYSLSDLEDINIKMHSISFRIMNK